MKKRTLLLATLLLLGAGCLPATGVNVVAPAPNDGGLATIVQFGEAVTLQMNQTRAVQGGLRVTLIDIGDSRCKPGVQCIWAGELSPKLRLDLPNGSSQELTLGTMRIKTADAAGYHFELKDATADSASVVVSR